MKIANSCPVCSSKNIIKNSAVLMPFIAERVFDWKPLKIDENFGFRTLQNGTSYSVCNSCICKTCSLLFSDIRFDEDEVNKLYNDYRGEEYINTREKYEPGYKSHNAYLSNEIHYLDKIEEYILSYIEKPKKILDWGGDEGVNTPFKNLNCDIDLFEVSDKQKNKSSGRFNFVNSKDNLNEKYDLLISMHVFEHLSYPLKSIKEIIEYLKPGGHIYVEVPLEKIINFEKKDFNILNKKKHWHEHINFYNYHSLSALCKEVDLNILDISEFDASDEYREFKIQRFLASRR